MNKALKIITEYLIIAIGAFFLAFATSFFLVPCKVSTGGVGGVGMILYHVAEVPVSVTTLVINLVLFGLGYKLLGGASILKTLAGIIFYSAFLEITSLFGTYTEDVLMASVFGGILVGIGVGLAVLKNASTGGSDLVAVIMHKLIPYIGVADFILMIDVCIIVASGLIFRNYTIMFYSVISLYISSKVTDYMLVRGDKAKAVHIISDKSEQIALKIMNDMERGVTGIYSRGLYSNKDGTMLMCVVKRKEIPEVMKKIKSLDKSAFIVVSDVTEVLGEGFKEV